MHAVIFSDFRSVSVCMLTDMRVRVVKYSLMLGILCEVLDGYRMHMYA